MGRPHHRHPKICGRFSTTVTGEKPTGATDGMGSNIVDNDDNCNGPGKITLNILSCPFSFMHHQGRQNKDSGEDFDQ
jgi:hypothetical protein